MWINDNDSPLGRLRRASFKGAPFFDNLTRKLEMGLETWVTRGGDKIEGVSSEPQLIYQNPFKGVNSK